jgi:carbamoyl-phosphate synthase large subunit
MLNVLKVKQPEGGIAKSDEDALAIAGKIGYPVLVRPSYVLGGCAMEIVYSDDKLKHYLETAVEVDPERPVLVDKYLADACEIDVDSLTDSKGTVVIGGIMEHIEQAGVHSGDSACSKAIGHPLAKYAALLMSGKSLRDIGFTQEVIPSHVSVKESVLPFEKFQGCDVVLGPEMRSTGEVMGIDFKFPMAFAKAQIAANQKLPLAGTVF